MELSERAGQSVGGAPKSICLSSLANSLACSLTELFVPLPKFEKSIDLVQCITLISCKVIHYFHIICQYLNVSKYNSVQGLCYLISLLSRRWYRTGGGRLSVKTMGNVDSVAVPPEFFQSMMPFNQPKLPHTWLGQY